MQRFYLKTYEKLHGSDFRGDNLVYICLSNKNLQACKGKQKMISREKGLPALSLFNDT